MNNITSFSKPIIKFNNLVYNNDKNDPKILCGERCIYLNEYGVVRVSENGGVDYFCDSVETEISVSFLTQYLLELLNKKLKIKIETLNNYKDSEIKYVLQNKDLINKINLVVLSNIRNYFILLMLNDNFIEVEDIIDFSNSILCNVFCLNIINQVMMNEGYEHRLILNKILLLCLNEYFDNLEDYNKFI